MYEPDVAVLAVLVVLVDVVAVVEVPPAAHGLGNGSLFSTPWAALFLFSVSKIKQCF